VYILAGYDRNYGFELYLNDKQTEVLGVMIVRLRKKVKMKFNGKRRD